MSGFLSSLLRAPQMLRGTAYPSSVSFITIKSTNLVFSLEEGFSCACDRSGSQSPEEPLLLLLLTQLKNDSDIMSHDSDNTENFAERLPAEKPPVEKRVKAHVHRASRGTPSKQALKGRGIPT